VTDVVAGVIRVLKGIIQYITGIFTGDWDKAWEGIKNIFGGVWDSVSGVFKGAINLVIDGINTLIRGINKLSIKIPKIPGITEGWTLGFNIKEIPKLARHKLRTAGYVCISPRRRGCRA
jgi:phage-related protein